MNNDHVLTSEQIDQIVRLEKIFSPHAHFQREEKRLHDNGGRTRSMDDVGRFAHYTSAEAALKIIESKRLWMRSTTCMVDYREVNHGFDLLLKCFSDDKRRSAFFSAMDKIYPDIAKSAVADFDQWWPNIQLKTFITSVSEHDAATENTLGRLSMWRAFGASPRVALVFSVPWYSQATMSLSIMFSPVAYLTEPEVFHVFDTVVASVEAEADFLRTLAPNVFRANIFQMLLASVCCLKHKGFSEEREWRGVFLEGLYESSLLEKTTEVFAGVPQSIFKIPFDGTVSPDLAAIDMSVILERIIIGPTSYPWVMQESFANVMRKIGIANPESKILMSDIPIRG